MGGGCEGGLRVWVGRIGWEDGMMGWVALRSIVTVGFMSGFLLLN